MLTTMRRRLRGRAATGRDAGFSLVEYTVSMAIFSVVIAITAGGIAMMSRDVVKTTNLSTSTDTIRNVFQRLDRQVRYATAINRPVLVGGTTWYVEFAAPDGSGVSTCHQWRLDTSTDAIQQRQWAGTPASAPAWTPVATNMANTPAQPPWIFIQATTDVPSQGLDVTLVAKKAARDTSAVSLSTSLSARNTTVSTGTNEDTNNDGVSDTEVCREVARS